MFKKVVFLVFSIVIVGTGLYISYSKYYAKAENDASNLIRLQSSLDYIDSQGENKTVESNIASTTILNTETPPVFTFDINGWYLFSLANKPAGNVTVADIFNNMNVENKLYRWDTFTQKLITYNSATISSDFGNTLETGLGYWVDHNVNTVDSISYSGAKEISPKIVDLNTATSSGGWAIIGNPFNNSINVETDIKFIKDDTEKNWADAALAGWIDGIGYGWNAQNQGLNDLGCLEDPCWASTNVLDVNQGAWVFLTTDGLSISINQKESS